MELQAGDVIRVSRHAGSPYGTKEHWAEWELLRHDGRAWHAQGVRTSEGPITSLSILDPSLEKNWVVEVMNLPQVEWVYSEGEE